METILKEGLSSLGLDTGKIPQLMEFSRLLLENNLQPDGSVLIPKALQPYMGGTERLVPKH